MESVKLDCGCKLVIEENHALLKSDDLICGHSSLAHIPEICKITGRSADISKNRTDLFYLFDEE